MPIFVEIAVSLPLQHGIFDYHVPPELESHVAPGQLVSVPFGSQIVQGVVLRTIPAPSVPETKPVLEIIDPAAVLPPYLLALAEKMAEQTLAPLAACINLMLPPGLAKQADILYQLRLPDISVDHDHAGLTPIQLRILELLKKRGALRGIQIDRALPRQEWRAPMRKLVKAGLVVNQSILPPPTIHPKFVRTAQLACSPEVAQKALPELGRPGSQALQRRQAILQYLIRELGPVVVTWVYAESGGNLQDLNILAERGLILLGESEVWRDPVLPVDYADPIRNAPPPALTRDQINAWQTISKHIQSAANGQSVKPVLLHGVTGSGKTELYLHAVQETLDFGRQVIILVPEIALTPQTVQRFTARFPGQVGLVHSRLSDGERYDTWRRARSGNLPVIIGPRSALFAPIPAPGLIIIDECHDDSYFQSDVTPYYHAVQTVLEYALLVNAVCLLGSATPDIATVYQASRGKMDYIHLPARILAHRQAIRAQMERAQLTTTQYHRLEGEVETIELPPVKVVDMRQELKAGNRSIFSRALQDALHQVLDNHQQAILFLNRRGAATFVFCRDCGFTLKCPRCDIPLTYHSDQTAAGLRCHYCGYQRKLPKNCPKCDSLQIRQYGAGTERVETELQNLFPTARTLRWDYETTRQKGAHEVILGHFAAHRADILIGTQMIAKGLDLPFITLVGAVLADVGLSLPDYRAAERTFQVLTQVAGRAGRSPLGGQVILQTFQPDHYVIQAAAKHSYREFYLKELDYRRRLGYPPFSSLVRLEYRHSEAKIAEKAAQTQAAEIHRWLNASPDLHLDIIGPTPCFFQRLAGQYRWQIILRGVDPLGLLQDRPMPEWKIEVNPPNLL